MEYFQKFDVTLSRAERRLLTRPLTRVVIRKYSSWMTDVRLEHPNFEAPRMGVVKSRVKVPMVVSMSEEIQLDYYIELLSEKRRVAVFL